jgi:hypothetical protein
MEVAGHSSEHLSHNDNRKKNRQPQGSVNKGTKSFFI